MAQYKGTGAVNGRPGYGFLLTAYDGNLIAGNSPPADGFRIKITDPSGSVVYDNKPGSSGDNLAANTQPLGGGSIVVHVPKP